MQIFLGNIKGVVDSVVVLFKALYNAMSIKSKDVHMEVSDCNDNGDISCVETLALFQTEFPRGQMTSRLPARPGSPVATLLLDCDSKPILQNTEEDRHQSRHTMTNTEQRTMDSIV